MELGLRVECQGLRLFGFRFGHEVVGRCTRGPTQQKQEKQKKVTTGHPKTLDRKTKTRNPQL